MFNILRLRNEDCIQMGMAFFLLYNLLLNMGRFTVKGLKYLKRCFENILKLHEIYSTDL